MLDYINVENSLYFAEKRERRIKKETIFDRIRSFLGGKRGEI